MRCVPQSICELLYLVRRSQGGVIAAQEMKAINGSTLCLTMVCFILMQLAQKCLLCGELKYPS